MHVESDGNIFLGVGAGRDGLRNTSSLSHPAKKNSGRNGTGWPILKIHPVSSHPVRDRDGTGWSRNITFIIFINLSLTKTNRTKWKILACYFLFFLELREIEMRVGEWEIERELRLRVIRTLDQMSIEKLLWVMTSILKCI